MGRARHVIMWVSEVYVNEVWHARSGIVVDGTRVHLLGAAEHGGHLLDHLEVGVKHKLMTIMSSPVGSVVGNGQMTPER